MKTKNDAFIVFLLVVITFFVIYPVHRNILNKAKAEPIDSYSSSWQRIEDSASEDGADFAAVLNIDANEGNWANKTDDAFQIPPLFGQPGSRYSPGTRWMFAFFGADAADDTFSFNLIGWASTNGFAQNICEGNGVLGAQDVVIEPNGDSAGHEYWADTITLDEQTKWPSYDGTLGSPGVAVFNSGDDEVALLVVELFGIEWIDFVFYDVAGSAEASSMGVYGRRY
jgi:hypothetical protein